MLENNNKRIAKNTLVIYIRLFLSIIVGLLTSRYVLLSLGASDYGLYNVVGSIIAMYAFISGSLSSTTIRFLNYEMGKPNGNLNKIFNVCNVLHISLAILILFISETFGIWYINNYLNVAPGKEADAMFVFQVSIVVSCIGIVNVPYQSLFNVHENFLFPAILDILVQLVKLAFVFLLLIYNGNSLRFYALSMSMLTFIYFIVYHLTAYRKWRDIIRWSFVDKWTEYKEIVTYNNYTILQTLATTARNQGSNILINLFFGTIVNAAYAIANTLQNYVVMFMGIMDGASAPQITQSIASNDMGRGMYLAKKVCRFCILLCELVALPLYVEMDLILRLWLSNPPEGTTIFCRLILLIAIVAATSAGMFQLINASGKVKWFRISVSVCFLSSLPIGYLLFTFGMPSYTILVLFILSDIFNRIIFLVLMRYILNFNIREFLHEAYFRPFVIFLIMFFFVCAYTNIGLTTTFQHVIGFFLTLMFSSFIIFYVGLKNSERRKIYNTFLSRINF